MNKFLSYLFALLAISNLAFAQGQPGEEGPPYYGLELPPYGSGREAFEAFEKEVEQRKREQAGYLPPPYENALEVINHGPSFHEGVVLSYDEQAIEELKALALEFEDSKHRFDRRSAIHALGIIHSVDPQSVSFQYLKDYTVSIENNVSISQNERITTLSNAYMAISYSSDSDAYNFLTKRATTEFWGNKVPGIEINITHAGPDDEPFLMSAQTEAIRQLSALNDPRLSAFLDQLAAEVPPEQEEVHWAIESARNSESRDRLRALREATYAARLASLRLATQVEEHAAEPLATFEVEKVAQESTVTKPAVEEPAEAEMPKPSEELAEQPSQWWLWLIGAMVVIGGIGLALRRKS